MAQTVLNVSMEEDVKISAPKPRALNATTVSAIEETEAGTGLRREKDLNKFLAELKE